MPNSNILMYTTEDGLTKIEATFENDTVWLSIDQISTIMMGILLDYVYEKTETIWLPSLMHGAINAFTIFAYLVKPEYSNMAILGPAYIGIISMIPMIIVAVIICVKTKRN